MASGPQAIKVDDWVTVKPEVNDWVDVKTPTDDWVDVSSPGRGGKINLPKLTPDTSNRPGFLRTLWDKSVLNLPQSIPAFGEMLKRGGDVKQSIEGLEQITPEMWAAHDARIKATRQTGQPTRRETFIGPPVDSSSQDESSWGEIAGTMASEPLNAAILGAATGMAVKGFRLAKKAAAAKVARKGMAAVEPIAEAKKNDSFSQVLNSWKAAAEREAEALKGQPEPPTGAADKLAAAKRKDAFSQMLAQYEGAAEREAPPTPRSSSRAPSPKELARRTSEIVFGQNAGPGPHPLDLPPDGDISPWKPSGPRDVSTLPPKTVPDAPAPRRPVWPSNEYRPPPQPSSSRYYNHDPYAEPFVNPPYQPIISSRLRPYVAEAAAEPQPRQWKNQFGVAEPSPGSAAKSVRDVSAKKTETANESPSSGASAATGNPASGASTTLGESESVYKSGAHDSMFVQDDNVVNKISNVSQYIREHGGLTPADLDNMTDAGFRVIADKAVTWGAAKGNPVPKNLKYATASVKGSTYAKIKRELHPDVYDKASLNKHIPTSRLKGGKK